MEKNTKLVEIKKLITDLKEQIDELEGEIIVTDNLEGKYETETDALEKESNKVNKRLRLFIFLALGILTISMIIKTKKNDNAFMIVRSVIIVISCGAMGSSISALTSSLERRANGWELKSGIKLPRQIPKDKFSMRMLPFFRYRPVLGIVAAVLVWSMIKSGLIKIEELNDYHLIFWSILSGLFAKTLFDKLKDLLKSKVPGSS